MIPKKPRLGLEPVEATTSTLREFIVGTPDESAELLRARAGTPAPVT
jgi:hypothetical protein